MNSKPNTPENTRIKTDIDWKLDRWRSHNAHQQPVYPNQLRQMDRLPPAKRAASGTQCPTQTSTLTRVYGKCRFSGRRRIQTSDLCGVNAA